MIKLLFFARLREDLDCGEESFELTSDISTVGDLHQQLCDRSELWAQTLQTDGLFIAVDQKIVEWDTPLTGNEEVAFFPPVTGG